MNTKLLFQNIIMLFAGILFFASCDKVEPPFNENLNSSSSNEQGHIELTSIPGTVSNIHFEKNYITDSTSLNSNWIITNNGTGLSGTVTFKWHNSTGQISGSGPIGGPIIFDGTIMIEEGGLFGKIFFDYNAELSVSGSGIGIAVGYVYQNALIEDYTGHKCGNCPRASRNAYDFKTLYPNRVIIMAVHAGFFAEPNLGTGAFTYDFRTPAGDVFDTYFGISIAGNPNGMVNRKIVNGSPILAYTAWSSTATNIFNEKDKYPDATIHIDNSFDAATRNLTVDVSCAFLIDFSGVYKLGVYLVEDSVINWQKDYDLTPNDIPDYVHRDVLRGDINSMWGEDVVTSFIQANSIINKTYTKIINTTYNEAHCKVLAFLYKDSTKEIVQVKEEPVLQ
ncbi:MAG: Omp28-related outer membrane protein [Bacteroidia bacterium]